MSDWLETFSYDLHRTVSRDAAQHFNKNFFYAQKYPIFEFLLLENMQPQDTSDFVHLTDSPQFL